MPLATYFAGPKVRWLLDNVPGLREDAERGDALFGTIDTWLIWNLTGGVHGGSHVTDVSNAARTMLMSLEGTAWNNEILAAMGIPKSMLPASGHPDRPLRLYNGDGPFGGRIPVCGDLGDQHAAMVGQACFSPGEAKNTYGTGCFMLFNTGTPSSRQMRAADNAGIPHWRLAGGVRLEGSIAIPEHSSSGCGITFASFNIRRGRKPGATVEITEASISCLLFPACLRPTGAAMHAG